MQDTGIGMTPTELSEVFELFAQAARADHAVQGGLGVGLSLAKSLATLHGGTLEARSEGPGTGSEFTLTLPVTSAAANTEQVEIAPAEPRPLSSIKVLVVDDNIDAAESLSLLLAGSGHDVRTAHGGVDAVRIAKDFVPHAMILDLGMPEMDGFAVAQAVRADASLASTRLIALSGYGQPEDRRRTAAAGFEAHLIKPVNPDELLARLT